jgi:hypothetical protein
MPMTEHRHARPDPATEAAAEPSRRAEPTRTDWKAEARKWEQRAKDNQKAAKALEASARPR